MEENVTQTVQHSHLCLY